MELDSIEGVIRLPEDKLRDLQVQLRAWRKKKGCKKRELLSLLGLLNHACKAVRAGRSFLCRLIDESTKEKKLEHFVRLNEDARSDIEWWYRFAETWNGVSMLSSLNNNPLLLLLLLMHLVHGGAEHSVVWSGFNFAGTTISSTPISLSRS